MGFSPPSIWVLSSIVAASTATAADGSGFGERNILLALGCVFTVAVKVVDGGAGDEVSEDLSVLG